MGHNITHDGSMVLVYIYIYANIGGILMVNVTINIYIAYMDPMGYIIVRIHQLSSLMGSSHDVENGSRTGSNSYPSLSSYRVKVSFLFVLR